MKASGNGVECGKEEILGKFIPGLSHVACLSLSILFKEIKELHTSIIS